MLHVYLRATVIILQVPVLRQCGKTRFSNSEFERKLQKHITKATCLLKTHIVQTDFLSIKLIFAFNCVLFEI